MIPKTLNYCGDRIHCQLHNQFIIGLHFIWTWTRNLNMIPWIFQQKILRSWVSTWIGIYMSFWRSIRLILWCYALRYLNTRLSRNQFRTLIHYHFLSRLTYTCQVWSGFIGLNIKKRELLLKGRKTSLSRLQSKKRSRPTFNSDIIKINFYNKGCQAFTYFLYQHDSRAHYWAPAVPVSFHCQTG